MEGERLVTLEQALAELRAKDANTQHKLDILISHNPQSKNLIPSAQITSVTSKAHGIKLALLLEFDGDRTKGMAFLNSCQVYICLCLNSFMDKQAKIVWAMSYMKAGRAAKWSAHVFRWEEQPENVGYHKFVDWEDFWDEFKREFCPVYADSVAINQLESTAYYQKSRSVDEYLDEFQDLIMEAGYSDPKTIVVNFCRGLDTQIQNAIATMPSGHPSDMVPTDCTLQPGPLTRTEPPMKLSNLPTALQVLLQRCPIQPPSTLFDFRLQSGAWITNMLQSPETLFWWILMLVRKHSHFHSLATDAEKQGTKHPTVLSNSTSESWV